MKPIMLATQLSLGRKRSLVQGIGFNDADYVIGGNGWRCPFYKKWESMLQRCYSPKWHKQNPTYIGCSVCPEWRYFSKFRLWMSTQNWKGMELDKDLLVKDNQVYGPDTCCFLPTAINCLFGGSKKKNNLPQGVNLSSNGNYKVQVWIRPGKRYTKTLPTFKEAYTHALEKKIEAVRYGAHDPRLSVTVILALGGHIHEMQETIKSI